jgi:hypothetical protein
MTNPFNPKVPMWTTAQQQAIVLDNIANVAMMKAARDIPEWNLLRHVIRASIPTRLEYNILMGYIDNVIFPQTFNLKRNGRAN